MKSCPILTSHIQIRKCLGDVCALWDAGKEPNLDHPGYFPGCSLVPRSQRVKWE
jgi:hypothetical protein